VAAKTRRLRLNRPGSQRVSVIRSVGWREGFGRVGLAPGGCPVGGSDGAPRRGRPVSQQDRGRTGRHGLQHLDGQHWSRWLRPHFITRAGMGLCVRPNRYALALATGSALGADVFALHECDDPVCVKVSGFWGAV